MSSMLYGLGHWCYRHRGRVIAIWMALLVAFGGGALAFGGTFQNDFKIPSAPSQLALDQLNMTFPEASGLSALEIVVAPPGSSVNEPAIRSAIEAGMTKMDQLSFVERVTSPWDPLMTGLVSDDQSAAVVQLMLRFDEPPTIEQLQPLVDIANETQAQLPAGGTAGMGGQAFAFEVPGLSLIEVLGLVVALIVLVAVLGSLVAAGLPLITALLGVGISTLLMFIAARIIAINTTTPLLSVMLGLAVGIDYALFILSRHRDQLGTGMDAEESAARSVATAGSAVIFAGLTVFIALVGLFVAGIPFLTVMGAFAAIAVLIAVLIALTLLPAFMGLLGERMRPTPKKGRRAAAEGGKATPRNEGDQHRPAPGSGHKGAAEHPTGVFAWWVRVVTKVPILTVVVIVFGLVLLSLPARNLQLSLPNSGQHHIGAPDRIAYDRINEHFGPGFNGPLVMTAEIIGSTDPLGVLDGLKKDVLATPGVDKVLISTPNRNADTGFMQIIPTTGPDDPATASLVKTLRERAPEWQSKYGVATAITGLTAVEIDISDQLGNALLPFGIFVVGLSLVLLTMVFRSIAVPIKATLGYLLSVGAAFGATQLVFNEGWFARVINLERGMAIISFLPILLMGILFGLAMDYQVFLVSRIREEYVHGRSARDAIAWGVAGSGKVVAGAAVIMLAVFAFFVPEGDGPIKAIAFALAIGVAIDAFLIRMTLVPAVLQLLGDKAWWLPSWLDKHLPSLDVEGESLARELELRDWPGNGSLLHAEGVTVTPVFSPLTLDVAPGQTVAIAAEPQAHTAALLALSGRLALSEGRARVGGELLPQQAGKVRRHTAYIEADPDTDFAAELERARRFSPRVYFIDAADVLPRPADRDALSALIAEARASGDFIVVLGVAEPDLVTQFDPDGVLPLAGHLQPVGS